MTEDHILNMGTPIAMQSGVELTPEMAVELVQLGGTSAIDGDEVLGIAGILPQWRGTGVGWCWLTRNWRRHAKVITAAVRQQIADSPLQRIEIAVRTDFPAGHRWATKLGMKLETPLAEKWGPDGLDYSIYVRIR